MKVNLKQGSLITYLTIALVAVGVLYAGVVLNSERAEASPPYKIYYTTDETHWVGSSGTVEMTSATIIQPTDDAWVFLHDGDHDLGEVIWNGWEAKTSTYSGSNNLEYHPGSWPEGYKFRPLNAGPAGTNIMKVVPTDKSYPVITAEYTVPYGLEYLNYSYPNFKINSLIYYPGSRFAVAGTETVGGVTKWKIIANTLDNNDAFGDAAYNSENLEFDVAAINVLAGPLNNKQLKDITASANQKTLVAVGSYEDGADKPIVASFNYYTGALRELNTDAWGAGIDGVVNSVVVGLDDVYDTALLSKDVEESAYFAGFQKVGGNSVWAINKINFKNIGNPAPVAVGGGTEGEALVITKDDDYIYVGGYTKDASDNPIWHLEKRKRSDITLVDVINLPAVIGKVMALDIEISQGVDALWAAGYRNVGGNNQWYFHKFTFNGGLFEDSLINGPATAVPGQIKTITILGAKDIYFGGEQDNTPTDSTWRIDRYDFDGNMKSPSTLSKNLGGGKSVLSDAAGEIVVGWNGDTGESIVQGIKRYREMATCAVPDTAASLAGRRYEINYGNNGMGSASPGEDMSKVENQFNAGIALLADQTAVGIPAGKYDVTQIAYDGHSERRNYSDQTQDREQMVTYFFGSAFDGTNDPAGFAKTDISDDVPNDGNFSRTTQTGLTINFPVTSATVVHPIYDLSSNVTGPLDKGTLDYTKTRWSDEGSVNAVCTVLDRYPQCNDGIDNDGDGRIDDVSVNPGNADGGCDSASDDSEDDGTVGTSCTLNPADYNLVVPIMAGMIDPINTLISFKLNAPHPVWPPFASSTIDISGLLPPGSYEVTLESEDGYAGRASEPTHQTAESWQVFLYSDYAVATSAYSIASPDLQDIEYTQEVEIVNPVSNPLVVPAGVKGIRAVHTIPIGNNSVQAVCAGFRLVGGATKPNLRFPNVGAVLPVNEDHWDRTTGEWLRVRIWYETKNDSSVDIVNSFKNGFTSIFGGLVDPVNYSSNPLYNETSFSSGLVANGSKPEMKVLGKNVPPGEYKVKILADSDGVIDESNEGDNLYETADGLWLPAPEPDIKLWPEHQFVRVGDPAILHWDTEATYSMSCDVTGPGLGLMGVNLNPKDVGNHTDIINVPEVNSKSQYCIKCTEKISEKNQSFNEVCTTIETVGVVREL